MTQFSVSYEMCVMVSFYSSIFRLHFPANQALQQLVFLSKYMIPYNTHRSTFFPSFFFGSSMGYSTLYYDSLASSMYRYTFTNNAYKMVKYFQCMFAVGR